MTFKYSVILGRSIWLFGHPQHQNTSIIDAMGYCSRIKKDVTENREQVENREKRNQLHRPLYRRTDGTPG